MKTKISLLLLFLGQLVLGQNLKMTLKNVTSHPELREVLYFQNIQVSEFNFENEKLGGKHFEVNVYEFVEGKLKQKTQLLDTSEADFLKIKYSPFSMKIFTQVLRGTFSIKVDFYNISSKTLDLDILEKNKSRDYIAKDFFGNKIVKEYPMNKEIPLLAIITSTIHSDGSGSYCEVVQTDILPEKLGEHFKIPHYFLVTMKVK